MKKISNFRFFTVNVLKYIMYSIYQRGVKYAELIFDIN